MLPREILLCSRGLNPPNLRTVIQEIRNGRPEEESGNRRPHRGGESKISPLSGSRQADSSDRRRGPAAEVAPQSSDQAKERPERARPKPWKSATFPRQTRLLTLPLLDSLPLRLPASPTPIPVYRKLRSDRGRPNRPGRPATPIDRPDPAWSGAFAAFLRSCSSGSGDQASRSGGPAEKLIFEIPFLVKLGLGKNF